MRLLRILGALSVLCALGGPMASAAVALPDVSLNLGGAYPLEDLASSTTAKTALSTSAGTFLTGAGYLVQLITKELSSLGTFTALFTRIKTSEGIECSSAGDKAGEVLLKGEFHVVPVKLVPLTGGILFLVEEVTLTCGAQKIKLKGDMVTSLTAGEGEITESSGSLTGNSKGVPTIKDYFNDEGKEIATKLEANFGGGFVSSAVEIAGSISFVAQGGKMFEITGR